MSGLRYWISHGVHQKIWEVDNGPLAEISEEAIKDQNAIGWGFIFRSRIVTKQGIIQSEVYLINFHDKDKPKHLTGVCEQQISSVKSSF